jgi:lipopolysaccharide transport system ATP-binding protein
VSDSLLSVRGIGKAFRDYGSEWRRFASWVGLHSRAKTETWVLRGVSFNVARGESIGIVGQNGAGKSTLLKLITGTLRSTEGTIGINGRIAAILELGMGFSPDLSGRANVQHTAGLMGFPREAIAGVMAYIEEFAEIGEYFDEPVRTYSSGMQMRVAFAVATAFRPDILIVDEALSVGDAYFQHKCFKRIREFREQGTSLLIVSHDSSAVQALCDRALLLENGALVKDGDPAEVMDLYNALIAERENSSITISNHASGRAQTVSGSGEATVENIRLLNGLQEHVEFVDVGELVTLLVDVLAVREVPKLVLGYMIKDRLGQTVFGTNTFHTEQAIENIGAGQRINFRINFPMNLGPGSYSVSTALVSTDTHLVNNYEWRDLALIFTVSNISREIFVGSAWVPPQIEISIS